jgi:Mor family transcriptional regulator
MPERDIYKDNGILLEHSVLLDLSHEVTLMAENNPELLNAVYKEISEKMGMDTAMEIYRMFKGQQVSFPMRFFNPVQIQKCILREYDGTNLKMLAIKYGYSEKTVRRIIKDSVNV